MAVFSPQGTFGWIEEEFPYEHLIQKWGTARATPSTPEEYKKAYLDIVAFVSQHTIMPADNLLTPEQDPRGMAYYAGAELAKKLFLEGRTLTDYIEDELQGARFPNDILADVLTGYHRGIAACKGIVQEAAIFSLQNNTGGYSYDMEAGQAHSIAIDRVMVQSQLCDPSVNIFTQDGMLGWEEFLGQTFKNMVAFFQNEIKPSAGQMALDCNISPNLPITPDDISTLYDDIHTQLWQLAKLVHRRQAQTIASEMYEDTYPMPANDYVATWASYIICGLINQPAQLHDTIVLPDPRGEVENQTLQPAQIRKAAIDAINTAYKPKTQTHAIEHPDDYLGAPPSPYDPDKILAGTSNYNEIFLDGTQEFNK